MTKRRYLIFLLLLLVLLTISVACGGKTRPTPTPFAEGGATETALGVATPLALSIADLAANPEAYASNFIEITGQYQKRPLLVCDTDPHPAPATWQLVAPDGSLVDVGGFDSQVRSLLPSNITMTVVGVWQLFEGPVGCGKNATNTHIWYLKASDILSPSPIARVTLTPTGSGAQIADSGDGATASTPGINDGSTPAATRTEEDDPLASTPTLPGTGIPAPPGIGTPSIAPTDDDSGTSSTPSPTSNGTRETATPTNSTGGVATPTPTNTGSTSLATPTSSSGSGGNPTPTNPALTTATPDPNEFDTVEFEDLLGITPVLEILETKQAHLYPIIFEYSGAITVTAVGEPTMNIVLEVLDPANNVVAQANNGGSGEREAIVDTRLNIDLDYRIRIYNLNDVEGNYCLIYSEGEGFADSIKGRLNYGQTITANIEEFAINYWCFVGAEGDRISATVSATGSSGDFTLGLFGPPGFEAIGTPFQAATISNVTLEEDSMYIIGLYNEEFDVAGYSLTLTKN